MLLIENLEYPGKYSSIFVHTTVSSSEHPTISNRREKRKSEANGSIQEKEPTQKKKNRA